MNQDVSPLLLPEGYVYFAQNVLFDKVGIARKRGGIVGVGATATYAADNLGALLKEDGTVQLYGLQGNVSPMFVSINSTTGAMTTLLTTGAVGIYNDNGGRPFQHYGFLIWPLNANGAAINTGVAAVAGASGSVAPYTFATPASCVLTAGDKRVACAAGDTPVTHAQIGSIFTASNANFRYRGRVTNIISSTAFEVYPTPPVSITATGADFAAFTLTGPSGGAPRAYVSGKVGMSFQGRVVLGNCTRHDSAGANRVEYFGRRVYFSSTLLEGDATPAARETGAVWLVNNGFPDLNYFDIPGQDPITAMAPTGFGDAVIFSAFKGFRVTGNLSTQFGTDQAITWAVREIPNSVGCMSERGMQRTPRGIIFPHASGIYTTDGTSMQPLMFGRMQNYWKALVASAGFKVTGSALIYGNHYYICGIQDGNSTGWGLMVNLDTLAWGTIVSEPVNGSARINSSVQDPSNPSRIWGLRWLFPSGVGVSMIGGQLVELETMFSPSSTNVTDADATWPIEFSILTRPYSEDTETLQKHWSEVTVEYKNSGGISLVFSPMFSINPSDAFQSGGGGGQLSAQDPFTITGATNAAPIVLTVSVTHDILANDWVRVAGVLGNTHANGPYRVQSVTGTTITLVGSYGNGAYTSGGTVQVMDQKDFTLVNASQFGGDQNNAAVFYRLTSQAASEIELYGITHSWENREPHRE